MYFQRLAAYLILFLSLSGGFSLAAEAGGAPQIRPLVYLIMAVSSMGKTTQGENLAKRLGVRFYEPDDFLGEANKKKIASGMALTDEDRWPWLDHLHEIIEKHLREGKQAVMACSALKRIYRQRLGIPNPKVQLIYLKGTLEMALANNRKRKGHFAPEQTVRNNFAVLEEPLPEENALVVPIDPTNSDLTFERMVKGLGL